VGDDENSLKEQARHSATQCNTVQHSATQCNTVQHTAAHCSIVQRTATHCNALQRNAAHCNALQHTATHCNTPHHTAARCTTRRLWATRCNTLQHAAAHCNTQFKYCNALHRKEGVLMSRISSRSKPYCVCLSVHVFFFSCLCACVFACVQCCSISSDSSPIGAWTLQGYRYFSFPVYINTYSYRCKRLHLYNNF